MGKKQYGDYPVNTLRKPILAAKHNKADIEKYLADFTEYESLMTNLSNKQKIYNKHVNEINDIINEFIKIESGLNEIPEQYQDKVYNKAYEDCHGNGMYSVYLELCSLVEIFN